MGLNTYLAKTVANGNRACFPVDGTDLTNTGFSAPTAGGTIFEIDNGNGPQVLDIEKGDWLIAYVAGKSTAHLVDGVHLPNGAGDYTKVQFRLSSKTPNIYADTPSNLYHIKAEDLENWSEFFITGRASGSFYLLNKQFDMAALSHDPQFRFKFRHPFLIEAVSDTIVHFF